MTHSQFTIEGSQGINDYTGLLNRTLMAGKRVASDGQVVIVDFQMAVQVKQWASAPPGDDDEWEEILLACLRVRDGALYLASVGSGPAEVPCPDGMYQRKICGRGFIGRGWPGTTTPGDEWRIQAWPTPEFRPPLETKTRRGSGETRP